MNDNEYKLDIPCFLSIEILLVDVPVSVLGRCQHNLGSKIRKTNGHLSNIMAINPGVLLSSGLFQFNLICF